MVMIHYNHVRDIANETRKEEKKKRETFKRREKKENKWE